MCRPMDKPKGRSMASKPKENGWRGTDERLHTLSWARLDLFSFIMGIVLSVSRTLKTEPIWEPCSGRDRDGGGGVVFELGKVICVTVSLGAEIPCSLWVRKNCSMAWPASRRASGRACFFFFLSLSLCLLAGFSREQVWPTS